MVQRCGDEVTDSSRQTKLNFHGGQVLIKFEKLEKSSVESGTRSSSVILYTHLFLFTPPPNPPLLPAPAAQFVRSLPRSPFHPISSFARSRTSPTSLTEVLFRSALSLEASPSTARDSTFRLSYSPKRARVAAASPPILDFALPHPY